MTRSSVALAPARRRRRHDFGFAARAMARRWFDPIPFPEEGERTLARLSAEGEVVHVMRSSGVLNFLFLAWSLIKRGLPPLRAALGLHWTFWSPFRRLFHDGPAASRLTRALDAGASALVFLREPSGLVPRLEPKEDPFFALIARARASPRPLYLVPELFLWSNRARNLKPNLRDLVFGSPEAPGVLLTAWAFLLNYRNAFFRIGRPVDLTAFVRENASAPDAALVRKVRGALYHHLARETRAIVGPPRKEPARIVEETLRDRTLRGALEKIAAEEQLDPLVARARAQRNLEQIAARYSPVLVAAIKPILDWVFNRIYSGIVIDEGGLQRALDKAREAPLVFCPSHKSHLDYLLMSWVLVDRGFMPPLVAAGANLSFWPAGPLLRRLGAFFLRRTFKGDRIYAATFRAYVKKLLREGYPQEFFIEGTRSRTGKLLSPRLGMVAFEVEAFLEGVQDDVYFVPVALDYERVAEAKSYARELAGAEKRPESIKSLLAAPKVLTARYGSIYLSFEEPISLKRFLLGRAGDLAQITEEQKRLAIRALAQRIGFGIGRAATITPAALLAAALLAHRRRGITAREAAARIEWLRGLAAREGARTSPALAHAPSDPCEPGPLNDVLRLFMEDGLVQVQAVGADTIYTVPDEKRPGLCFYKNNLLHLLVGRSMVAFALLSMDGQGTLGEIGERVRFLALLLKLEFSYPVGFSFESLLAVTLEALAAEGLLERADGRVRASADPERLAGLVFLRELTRDLVESYRVAAATLPRAQAELDKKELLKAALEQGRADYLAGAIACLEALSKPTLENAVALFVERGLLVASADGKHLVLAPHAVAARAGEELVAKLDHLLAPERARYAGNFLPVAAGR